MFDGDYMPCSRGKRKIAAGDRSGSNGRAQSLEIPLLSRRLGDPVYDAGRKTWRGPGAPATQLSGASARTVQSHELRTDIDVDVVHVAVRHDAARVVVGD